MKVLLEATNNINSFIATNFESALADKNLLKLLSDHLSKYYRPNDEVEFTFFTSLVDTLISSEVITLPVSSLTTKKLSWIEQNVSLNKYTEDFLDSPIILEHAPYQDDVTLKDFQYLCEVGNILYSPKLQRKYYNKLSQSTLTDIFYNNQGNLREIGYDKNHNHSETIYHKIETLGDSGGDGLSIIQNLKNASNSTVFAKIRDLCLTMHIQNMDVVASYMKNDTAPRGHSADFEELVDIINTFGYNNGLKYNKIESILSWFNTFKAEYKKWQSNPYLSTR